MNGWYFLSVPAYLVLIITAAARLADLGKQHMELIHHVRRVGLMGVGLIAAVLLLTPWTTDRWFYSMPTWRSFVLAWSWALVWLTTESLPPWYDYILGVHRRTDQWAGLGWRGRLAGEIAALRDSFKPRRYRPAVEDTPRRDATVVARE